MNWLFHGIFDSTFTSVIAPGDFLLCIGVSLMIGLLLCGMCQWRKSSGGSFALTLALLPATVCVVIMMVNGNVGAGVAVAGAFSLVRFRSAAGTGREIVSIFIAMTAGLMTGMGYLGYAVLFALVLGGMMMVYTALCLGEHQKQPEKRTLRITIPEDLDYVGLFDPILSEYAQSYSLRSVKTTAMGSLFKLCYDLELKAPGTEKQMMDALRCLNGNLEIAVSLQEKQESLL